jgi:hypothetical protein
MPAKGVELHESKVREESTAEPGLARRERRGEVFVHQGVRGGTMGSTPPLIWFVPPKGAEWFHER